MRNITRLFTLLLSLALCGALATPQSQAQGQYTVTLRTLRPVLLSNGRDRTTIIAEIRDVTGRQVPNGTEVLFQTSQGNLSSVRTQTFGGLAQVELTGQVTGVARITATVRGATSEILEIGFTDDPEAVYQGNNYLQAAGSSYLSYSVTDRVIEAMGKNGGAKIAYRNAAISADRLQLYADDLIVRAINNVVIKRGKKSIKVSRLYYSLQLAQGYAIAELDNRLQLIKISGNDLAIEPLKTPIPNSYLQLPDLQVRLVVTAKSITLFPGDRLQFRQPHFFQDQSQIMVLPFYEMMLNSAELFSDQFISVGTNGFGLELPIYGNLSPNFKTVFFLRHQQQQGRSYFSQGQGWSIDAFQSYSKQGEQRAEGSYGFTGLTRGDWGFRWMHNQEFNSATQANFYVDFPQHQGVFSNANVSQQLKKVRWGTNLSVGQTFDSLADRTFRGDFYVESQPRQLAKSKDLLYTVGTNYSTTDVRTQSTDFGSFSDSTQNVNFRAFSRPLPLSQRTSLTHAWNIGQMWTRSGGSGLATSASLSLDHVFPKAGTMSLSYDFLKQPTSRFYSGGTHRMGLTYNLALSKNLQITVFGSGFLDAPEQSLLADAVYRIDNNWRIMLSGTFQKYEGLGFNDMQFTLGRRIGAREVQLTYSTFLHRISVDFTATRF